MIGIEHNEWLDMEDNANRWFCDDNKFTASERRILITHWAGNAWEKLISSKYESFIRKCWQKTGCLMTADGSDDTLIKPEGMVGYSAPPPLIMDPSPQPGTSNTPESVSNEEQQQEEEEVQLTFDDELVEGDDHPDDNDDIDRPNIFNFIDQLILE